jgi:hypothetical protein
VIANEAKLIRTLDLCCNKRYPFVTSIITNKFKQKKLFIVGYHAYSVSVTYEKDTHFNMPTSEVRRFACYE